MEDKIIGTINKTKEFYQQPSKSLFHNTISLIISQKISFSKSRTIRKKIYEEFTSSEMTYDNIKNLSKKQLLDFGLQEFQYDIIQRIINLGPNLVYDDIIKVKGIGEWTKKSLLLYAGNDDILLVEDYWIRQRIKNLFDLKTVPDKITAMSLINNIIKNKISKSLMTKFLWRIKPESVDKIKNDVELDKNDFI